MEGKLAIDDINISNKRILIRVDYDVPIIRGQVVNTEPIKKSLDTIRYALNHDAKAVILISHLGYPMGMVKDSLSLAPVANELRKLLAREIVYLPNCVGPLVEYLCEDPKPGSVILLENVRFHPEEEIIIKGKIAASEIRIRAFRESLRKIADIFVNDAFSTVRFHHSSVLAVGYELKVAGLAMKGNISDDLLRQNYDVFERPFIAIVAGYRVRDHTNLIKDLLKKVDEMIIAGGMALTFIHVLDGTPVGRTPVDKEAMKLAEEVIGIADSGGVALHFPLDFVVGDRFSPDAQLRVVTRQEGLRPDEMYLDIGPGSVNLFKYVISKANRLIWNGAIGEFQWPVFEQGTVRLLDGVGRAKYGGAITIAAGVDMAIAAERFDCKHFFTFISASHSAGITSLEGKKYPGIAVLIDKDKPCTCYHGTGGSEHMLFENKKFDKKRKPKDGEKEKCIDVSVLKSEMLK